MPTRFDPRERLIGPLSQGIVGSWLYRSPIKSVQYGTVAMAGTASATATINSVNVNYSIVIYLGATITIAGPSPAAYDCRLVVTNTTTITSLTGQNSTATVSFVVMEFMPGVLKSLQTGIITLGASPATATVTAVNTTKAIIFFPGSLVNAVDDRMQPSIILTNATTITATINTTGLGTSVIGYQLAEFY